MPRFVRCKNDEHTYDVDLYQAGCPACRTVDLSGVDYAAQPGHRKGGTRKVDQADTDAEQEQGNDRPDDHGTNRHTGPDPKKCVTVKVDQRGQETTFDPVVGWAVCVAGPDRGKDFRLRAGNNSIGPSHERDVPISGDPGVTDCVQATICFSDEENAFWLEKGHEGPLVKLNGKDVRGFANLSAFDRIELGQTTLMFVPLCGERFSWTAAAADESD